MALFSQRHTFGLSLHVSCANRGTVLMLPVMPQLVGPPRGGATRRIYSNSTHLGAHVRPELPRDYGSRYRQRDRLPWRRGGFDLHEHYPITWPVKRRFLCGGCGIPRWRAYRCTLNVRQSASLHALDRIGHAQWRPAIDTGYPCSRNRDMSDQQMDVDITSSS